MSKPSNNTDNQPTFSGFSEVNANESSVSHQISGLGGWLILIQIGLIYSLLSDIIQVMGNGIFNATTWDKLTNTAYDSYNSMWKPVLITQLAFYSVFTLFVLFTLISFYRKKSYLPKLMITYYAVSFLFSVVNFILVMQIDNLKTATDVPITQTSLVTGLVISAIISALWIGYFTRSKRVRNTFVN
ncbi:uncharacterized protein DUF2569 [Paenibacillus cellulosilyticus]|uniref:Uncharacterized protein DUF2569 n=1 Tax=Paenibacillus cellulosilyticus TaxID=375489 RepID=A0A2V2YT92_9BACL|nr:DUF2569 domain-containing protein [Paenibacillus cellulosilyticus]PWW02542.1 uncharacterized protein DUF2569 [Paenibacillus cellulosilyticus]QKS47238.1 DUF2569 domain-containing protein [Paenibacillus cellulosilyticus]